MQAKQLHRIEQIEKTLRSSLDNMLMRHVHRLQLMEKTIEGASPQLILQRGYTITRCDGRVVRDAASLPEGAVLVTEFADGEVKSVVGREL